MMNDESYYNIKRIREEWNMTLSQDDPHRTGIPFARRARLARVVGLAAMFFPLWRAGHLFCIRRLVVVPGGVGIYLAPFRLAVVLPRCFSSSAGTF